MICHRILVATGHSSVFMHVCESLERAGYQVVGPVQTYELLVRGVEGHDCSAAVLSTDLDDLGNGFAHYLRSRSLPVIFLGPREPIWKEHTEIVTAKTDREMISLLAEYLRPMLDD